VFDFLYVISLVIDPVLPCSIHHGGGLKNFAPPNITKYLAGGLMEQEKVKSYAEEELTNRYCSHIYRAIEVLLSYT
jgi:hypothetical protein